VFVLECFGPRTVAAGLVGPDRSIATGLEILSLAAGVSASAFPKLPVGPVLLLPGNCLLVSVVDNRA